MGNPMEVITISEAWAWIMAVFVAVTTIDKAIDIFKKWHKESPEGKQAEQLEKLDVRVTSVEKTLAQHGELLTHNKERFEIIEAGNHVTQEALLALLSHAIDGDDETNKEQLVSARNDLHQYLITKK